MVYSTTFPFSSFSALFRLGYGLFHLINMLSYAFCIPDIYWNILVVVTIFSHIHPLSLFPPTFFSVTCYFWYWCAFIWVGSWNAIVFLAHHPLVCRYWRIKFYSKWVPRRGFFSSDGDWSCCESVDFLAITITINTVFIVDMLGTVKALHMHHLV